MSKELITNKLVIQSSGVPMFIKNLPKQIQALIDHYCGGSLLAFSKKIGVPQSTLQYNMSRENEKNLLKILPKILSNCPEVSESWLYTGEGAMLGRPRPNGIRSAENSRGKLIGDLLFEALGAAQLEETEVAKVARLDKAEWQAVLESSEYPSYSMLQALYDQFGLNVEFLFSARSKMPWLPLSELQIVEFLLGRESAYPPSPRDLEEWFGCSKDEARDYLKQYKEWLVSIRENGFEKAYDEGVGEPVLKQEWIEHFCEHAELEWLPAMRPQEGGFIRLLPYSLKEEKRKLEHELAELRPRLDAALQKIIQLQEEVIDLQNSLKAQRSVLGQTSAHGDTMSC